MKLSRRAMIKDGMLVVSAGMVMPAIFSRGVASAKALSQEGAHFSQAASDHTLIVIQLAGGNDGLNTVVPYTDALYNKVRPTLAIPKNKVLTLYRRLGCQPDLARRKKNWEEGHLAVGEGVGSP